MATPVPIPNTEVKHRSADDTRKGKVSNRQNKIFNFKFYRGDIKVECGDDAQIGKVTSHLVMGFNFA